jgi:hypothetical protein
LLGWRERGDVPLFLLPQQPGSAIQCRDEFEKPVQGLFTVGISSDE